MIKLHDDLPINYTDYDLIEIISIVLPITNLVINDSDCNNKLAITFPSIELLTSSSVYLNNEDYFLGRNTLKTTIDNVEYPVNITSNIIDVPDNYGSINIAGHPSIIYVNGSNSTNPNSDFYLGTSNFTIEWWQYQVQTSVQEYSLVFSIGNSPNLCIAFEMGSISTNLLSLIRTSGPLVGEQEGINFGVTEAYKKTLKYKNKWTHVALVRNGNEISVYFDGTLFGEPYTKPQDNLNIPNTGHYLTIGNEASLINNTQFTGNITNFRWIKGTALYTSNFTPSFPLTAIANTKLLLLTNKDAPYVDSSTNNYTLSRYGSINWVRITPILPKLINLQIITNIINFTQTSLNVVSTDNTKLPNLFNYSSLNSETCETNDYFIQKPMILPFVNLSVGNTFTAPAINFYVMANMPRMKIFDNYSSKVYLNSNIVLSVYNLLSKQLLRDQNNSYSIYYESYLLNSNENINDIESKVVHIYDGMYEDIYGDVVTLIENAQNEYINSYTEIFNYISSGSKFGTTLQNIANRAELLNDYTLTSNKSMIKLSLYDATLVDFDSNTLLATGLYNFTNRDGNIMKTDYSMISALAYKYNIDPMKIVNSPWHSYVPYVKINPIVIKYLDRYSSYATNMNNNLIANKSALILVNNKNFPQEFNEEYEMRDKYYHLATDTNKFIIESSTINKEYFNENNTFGIYISKATIDDKEVLYDGANLYTNEDIEPYKYKPYSKETAYDNMKVYYKLVGAVSIKNNAINNKLVLPDYIIADNLTIIKTFNYENNKTFTENFYGINYNSRKLVISSSSSSNVTNISQLTFSKYKVFRCIIYIK